jgi:hypothetical protein
VANNPQLEATLLLRDSSSPTHTYVALVYDANFTHIRFRKFILPESVDIGVKFDEKGPVPNPFTLPNNTISAAWYYLNMINYVACIEGVVTWEDYQQLGSE